MNSLNIKYPFEDNKNTNEFLKTNIITKDSYISNLILLLTTEKGERYYDPNFGTNLLKHVFEFNDDTTAYNIEKNLRDTVSLYMPEIEITNVSFDFDGDDENKVLDNQLNINIEFRYNNGYYKEEGNINIII
ncbi:MAG TPA: GPW/gp25 family protein [archaeon]|nr:GPW/gp25 family protein [archaeon]